jgi:hypothetical protein
MDYIRWAKIKKVMFSNIVVCLMFEISDGVIITIANESLSYQYWQTSGGLSFHCQGQPTIKCKRFKEQNQILGLNIVVVPWREIELFS